MGVLEDKKGEEIIPPEEMHIKIAEFKEQLDKEEVIIEEPKQEKQRRGVDPKLRKELCKYINDWSYIDKLIQEHTEEELERFLARFQE